MFVVTRGWKHKETDRDDRGENDEAWFTEKWNKIIKDEDLQKNAKNVGSYLKKMLIDLQKNYSLIGDIRGEGLFLGLEIVNSNGLLEPMGKFAKYIVNEMKKRRVLLSTDGPDENIIKIKPPIIFNKQNADFLLENLRLVIAKI